MKHPALLTACCGIAALAVLHGAGSATLAGSPAPVPVMVGNDDELDACGGWGEPAGTAALPVRSAPDAGGRIVYEIKPGEGFWICDESADGQWTGIVAEHNPLTGDAGGDPQCGTGSPLSPRQPYPGPCIAGWVPADAVLLIAG